MQDNSDAQYRSFRNNILSLTLLSLSFLALKFVYSRLAFRSSSPPSNKLHHLPFLGAFALLMLLGLHGASTLKILAILGANYLLAKYARSPLTTWTFNAAVLFANEWYGGYHFAALHPSLASLVSPFFVLAFVLFVARNEVLTVGAFVR